MLDNSESTPLGVIKLKFQLGMRTFSRKFVVIESCSFPVLFGMDFLHTSGILVDFASMKWGFSRNKTFPFSLNAVDSEKVSVRSLKLLTEAQSESISLLLKKYPEVVDAPLGKVVPVQHKIEMTEECPKRLKPYPASPKKLDELDRQVQYMLEHGIIQHSNSPYSSPVLLKPKPNGEWRFIVDFRYINRFTIPDQFPQPRIHDMLRKLAKAKYLSSLDAEKGYWQVEMDPESRKYTAFSTNNQLYEFKRMAFGLKNAGATFQRLMNETLKGLENFCMVYQDDILVFSESFAEHLNHLETVLQRLKKAGITLSSSKCYFGKEKLKFLGHIISSKGLEKSTEKVDAILKLRTPRNKKDVRSFLGAVGYYRHFIPMLASLADPLYSIISIKSKFRWTDKEQSAFVQIKQAVCDDVVLSHPDFTKPFVLRTDACGTGVGAVLSQLNDAGEERPIAFASKTLNPAQRRYLSNEQECYAIIYGLNKFREYLDGYEFVLQTDNSALTYLDTMKNTNKRLMNWAWLLQEWSPCIQHVRGRDNTVSDFLSRFSINDETEINDEPSYMHPPMALTGTLTCNIDKTILRQEQQKDDNILSLPSTNPDDYACLNNIVYKKTNNKFLPCIPLSLRVNVIKCFHDDPTAAHLGVDRTLAKLQSRVHFPKMRSFVEKYIKTCDVCQRVKPDNRKPPGLMRSSEISQPWDCIYMDLMGPYVASHPGRYKNLLVLIDQFTKWVEIFPIREATSQCISKILEENVFSRFGRPKSIVSDNGTNFTSKIMKRLCARWKIKHNLCSIYHPQSNLTERANRTIKTMIRAYVDGQSHNKWARYLHFFQMAINSANQESTGHSPAKLMLNRELTLPFDNSINYDPHDLSANEEIKFPNYSGIQENTNLYQMLLSSVRLNIGKAQDKQKKYYDQKHRDDKLELGNHVVLMDKTKSNQSQGIVSGFAPLFDSKIGKISKIHNDLNYDVEFADGTTRGPLHIQFLRRYYPREAENQNTAVTEDTNTLNNDLIHVNDVIDTSHVHVDSVPRAASDSVDVPAQNPNSNQLPISDSVPNSNSIIVPNQEPVANSNDPTGSNSPQTVTSNPDPIPERPRNLRGKPRVDYRDTKTRRRRP
jgi:hypothetical protein